jgi:hypothetical protein
MIPLIMGDQIVIHYIHISLDLFLDWFSLGLVCDYDSLWNVSTLYFLFMSMNNCLVYFHMDLQCNSNWQPCAQIHYGL